MRNSVWRRNRLAGTLAVITWGVFASLPAQAGITFTCDSASFGADLPGACNTLNTTIASLYVSVFSNANASIYIQYGSTGLGSSLQYYTNVSYNSYATALTNHETDATDATAVASLGGTTTNPVVAGDGVALTSALHSALGLSGGLGIDSTNDNACTLGTSNCYNGVITITDNSGILYYRNGAQPGGTYDFYSVVEHEVDEILGTASCIVGSSPANITTSANCTNGPPSTGVGAADLFRYSAPGTRSYLSSANGTLAYFSIDGGNTNIAEYNNSPNGADYGDWGNTAIRIQNAFDTPGVNGFDITNDGGSEILVLDAVGYDMAAPEPGTLTLFGAGAAALAFLKLRKSRLG